MKEIRILVTGAGRRIELIQAFRQAALQLDVKLKLIAADMANTAPALAYCDATRKICAMRDPDYIRQLVKICEEDQIDLVLPTIDTDLLVLSENTAAFAAVGTRVLISKPDKIRLCRDKNLTGAFFASCGLKAPETWHDVKAYPGPYPCFIKPKDGSSSINAFKAENAEKLAVYAVQVEDYVIQPFVFGREYTVDIFCDFDGNPIYITPRERLQVRAGEVLKTQICNDAAMIAEAKQLCAAFRPCGPITVQLIREEKTREDFYIEINPRYGGGAPLSMKAGARSAEALLRLLCGEKLAYKESAACSGAVYSRFDQSVCISEGENTQPVRGVIFDLDDTLYSEKQYIRSGYRKIAEHLGRADAAEKLWQYYEEKLPPIDAYLAEIGENEKKAECLAVYRNQMPDITLYEGAAELIEALKAKGIRVGILTDGRPEGQRNKLRALGLDKMVEDIIVTDELGGEQFRKPCDIAYRILQTRWRLPAEEIVYVGDNPAKDFRACRQLGMRSIYFRNEDGLYSTEEQSDLVTVHSVAELRSFLFKHMF